MDFKLSLCLLVACLALLKHVSGFNVYQVRAPTRASPSPLGLGMLRSSDMLFPSLMWPTVTRAREIPVDRNSNSMLRVDVRETDTKWEIFAELPGFDSSELQVLMEEDTITIKAKKSEKDATIYKDSKDAVEQEATVWHLKERSSCLSLVEVERSFKLPSEVDSGQVSSLFKDGLLKVTIPKKTAEKKAFRMIEIKT